jgi:hypothetical protein
MYRNPPSSAITPFRLVVTGGDFQKLPNKAAYDVQRLQGRLLPDTVCLLEVDGDNTTGTGASKGAQSRERNGVTKSYRRAFISIRIRLS